MDLYDAHCHLQDERLLARLGEVLERAREAGVRRMVCCGTEESDWADVSRLAATQAAVRPAFGLHPWYLRSRGPDWRERLRRYLEDRRAAVGEIGLDHAIEPRDDADQEEVFLEQLHMARDMNRPVSLHCRRAWGRLIELLTRFGPLPGGMVIHSFSGAADLVPALCRLGLCFSFSGSVTRSANRRGRAALCAVPADRLLLETDAPDLMPVAPPSAREFGERVNHPANLRHVLDAAAALRGVPLEELAATTWQNACRVFGLGPELDTGT